MKAIALNRHPKYDSKLECAYAEYLEILKRAGEIWDYRHHGLRLRLADETMFTPDFLVIGAGATVELHECKGFMREAARVRLNVAAELYPWFTFKLVKRDKGKFEITEVSEAA